MSWWRHIRKFSAPDTIATISCFLSVIALSASVWSCVISDDLAQESHLQFNQDRQLVLAAKFAEDSKNECDEWVLKPIAEGFQYQQGRIFLPKQIFNEPVYVNSSGRVRFLRGACKAIQVYAAKTMAPKDSGSFTVGDRDIPIIIRSLYAVKGQVYEDESIYVLHGTISVPYNDVLGVRILFDGMSFIRRQNPEKPIDITVVDVMMTPSILK